MLNVSRGTVTLRTVKGASSEPTPNCTCQTDGEGGNHLLLPRDNSAPSASRRPNGERCALQTEPESTITAFVTAALRRVSTHEPCCSAQVTMQRRRPRMLAIGVRSGDITGGKWARHEHIASMTASLGHAGPGRQSD
jgi:hypothetical protein